VFRPVFFLGLALIFSSRPFYAFYERHAVGSWGLSPIPATRTPRRDRINGEQNARLLLAIGWYVLRLPRTTSERNSGDMTSFGKKGMKRKRDRD